MPSTMSKQATAAYPSEQMPQALRNIVDRWHGGQWSAFYSLSSTGMLHSAEHQSNALCELSACLSKAGPAERNALGLVREWVVRAGNQPTEGEQEARYLQSVADAYIECALFTADEEIVTPHSGAFDSSPYLGRVTKAMRAEALAVCTVFYYANRADLSMYDADDLGHDLWYTRNEHGVGFWDGDHCTKGVGERLTQAAHKLGQRSVYSGRGGWLYFDIG